MLQRKSGKASNTWFKEDTPLIEHGQRRGQRAALQPVAMVQVIPSGAVDENGEKKLNGFTVEELKELIAEGGTKVVANREGTITARVSVGDGMEQFTKSELKEIVAAIEKEGVNLTASPMDRFDRERISMERQILGGENATTRTATPSAKSTRTRKARAGNTEPGTVSE